MYENFFTRVVHSGTELNKYHGALSTPIFNASTYALPNAEEGSAIHEGQVGGYFYARMTNPTQDALEAALAQLEEGEAAMTFSSGMAAISCALLSVLKSGDHIIAPRSLYATTASFLAHVQERFGIQYTLVDGSSAQKYEEAIQPNTVAVYIESPANPNLTIVDIAAVAAIAKQKGLTSIMDNTFASPYNQQPLKLGVDLVVHSLTKYIGGHADILAGAIIGRADFIQKCRWTTNKFFGGVIAPQTAWLALRGIKTLALRMAKHNQNAQTVAEFLESHHKVIKVHYPGLPSHPQHALAKKQMKGFGGMIAFELENRILARRLVNQLKLCTLAVSLGDVSTLIQHSASMTHASVSKEHRMEAGIRDGLLRLSVGIEDPSDIVEDLNSTLNSI